MSKYTNERKETLMMCFLVKFKSFRPARMSKDKINNSISKYWDNDNFWFECGNKFGLFNEDFNEVSMVNLAKGADAFWKMLNDGLTAIKKENITGENN